MLETQPLRELQDRLPGEVVVGDHEPRLGPDDGGEVAEELPRVVEVAHDVAENDVVEGPRERELLDVAADESELRVTAPGLRDDSLRDVDAHAERRLQRSEQIAVAAAQVEDARARRHVVTNVAVQVLVVEAVPRAPAPARHGRVPQRGLHGARPSCGQLRSGNGRTCQDGEPMITAGAGR